MKIITLWQPWATLIALGIKIHETRSWSTKYRGPLAIHAAKRPVDRDGDRLVSEIYDSRLFGYDYPLGAIVAVADLADVVPAESAVPAWIDRFCGDFTPGRFAWRLANVRRCEMTYRGRQGLRDLPDEDAFRLLPQIDPILSEAAS